MSPEYDDFFKWVDRVKYYLPALLSLHDARKLYDLYILHEKMLKEGYEGVLHRLIIEER